MLMPANVLGGSEGQPTSAKKEPVAVMLSPILEKTAARFPVPCPAARILRKFVFMPASIVGTMGSVSARVAACAMGVAGIKNITLGRSELRVMLRPSKTERDFCQRGVEVCIIVWMAVLYGDRDLASKE